MLSGSRGPDGPDLPSPLGRKFQLSVQRRNHNLAATVLYSNSFKDQ